MAKVQAEGGCVCIVWNDDGLWDHTNVLTTVEEYDFCPSLCFLLLGIYILKARVLTEYWGNCIELKEKISLHTSRPVVHCVFPKLSRVLRCRRCSIELTSTWHPTDRRALTLSRPIWGVLLQLWIHGASRIFRASWQSWEYPTWVRRTPA